MKVALLVIVLGFVTATSHAAPTREHPLEDAAKVVPDADEPALESELATLRAQGVDLAVIVVSSTGRESIEAYARKRATGWGTATTPAAVLVLAIKDRKSRLEVSDLLRDKFPDARSKSILDNIKGYLRSADYTGAIRAVITEVRHGAGGVAADMESPHPQVPDPTPAPAETVVAPVAEPHAEYHPAPDERDWTPIIWLSLAGAILVLSAFLWARMRMAGRATMTANHVITSDRPLWAETLWCVCLILGGVIYFALIIMASGSGRRSTWSNSAGWSSAFTPHRGSSGWSGGGASSGW